jgi:starvation-inducible outer membrane lipoprotein
MNPRSIRSILIPWSLMLTACIGAPEGQIESSGQAPVSGEAVQPDEVEPQQSAAAASAETASLPEVRYYLIADT